jgi:hypothetical protein
MWRIEWELPMRYSGSGQTEWYLLWKSFSFAPGNQAALDHGRSKATAGVPGNGDLSGRILVFRIVQEEFSIEEFVTWVLSQEIDLDVAVVVSEGLKANLRNVSSAYLNPPRPEHRTHNRDCRQNENDSQCKNNLISATGHWQLLSRAVFWVRGAFRVLLNPMVKRQFHLFCNLLPSAHNISRHLSAIFNPSDQHTL